MLTAFTVPLFECNRSHIRPLLTLTVVLLIQAFAVVVLARASNFGGFLRGVDWLDCGVVPVDLVSSFFGFFLGVVSFVFGGDCDLVV